MVDIEIGPGVEVFKKHLDNPNYPGSRFVVIDAHRQPEMSDGGDVSEPVYPARREELIVIGTMLDAEVHSRTGRVRSKKWILDHARTTLVSRAELERAIDTGIANGPRTIRRP